MILFMKARVAGYTRRGPGGPVLVQPYSNSRRRAEAKFSPGAEADKIARAVEKMGLMVTRSRFGLSASQYLEVGSTREGESAVKIRVSDHTLPRSYAVINGDADYQVGPHMEANGSGWLDAASFLSRKFNVPLAGAAKSEAAKAAKAESEAAAKRAQAGALPPALAPFGDAVAARITDPMDRTAGWMRRLRGAFIDAGATAAAMDAHSAQAVAWLNKRAGGSGG